MRSRLQAKWQLKIPNLLHNSPGIALQQLHRQLRRTKIHWNKILITSQTELVTLALSREDSLLARAAKNIIYIKSSTQTSH